MADGAFIKDKPPPAGPAPVLTSGLFRLDLDRVRELHARYPEASAFDAEGRPIGLVKRDADWDDVVDAPEAFKAELIGGRMYMQPAPVNRHGRIQRILSSRIGGPFDDEPGPGGWWFVIDPQLNLGDDAFRPDLAAWRRERLPEFPDATHFTLAPDWICEVLSPSTASYDRGDKKDAYARHGVAHLWHVDPVARTLEAFSLDGAHYDPVGTYEGDGLVEIPPFDAIALPLDKLWS